MHTLLNVSNLSFEFPNGRQIFNNLSFSLYCRLTALVGPNGIGKTTLAQLLCGELEPTSGVIRRNQSLTFLPQRKEPFAISINEFLGFNYIWSALGERLLENLDREALCTNLSGGEWMRVRLAATLDNQFLILDEPTNDLDRTGRNLILTFLREREGGALLISHDRECLSLCEEVLELSNRGLTKYGGGWETYAEIRDLERKNLQNALELATQERDSAINKRNQQKERQEKRNRQGVEAGARGGMPKILLGARKRRAQVTTGKIDVTTLELTQEAAQKAFQAFKEVKIDPVMYADLIKSEIPSQKLVAEANEFNIRFNDWVYFENLNFVWRGNIRIALKGDNGSGKSTLLKAILGQEFETRGQLRTGNLTKLYIDQRCSILDDNKSIFENIRDSSNLDESEIRNSLAKFLFSKEIVFQKISDLSGGERLRAALAKGFLSVQKPELLVLDEPTNNLDLVNIEFLEKLVSEFCGAVIVISHDEVFLANCKVTEEIELYGGKK